MAVAFMGFEVNAFTLGYFQNGDITYNAINYLLFNHIFIFCAAKLTQNYLNRKY